MSREPDQGGSGALPLLEEAVHLLRRAEISALWVYCAGTIPFCLGALLFWARLSRRWIPPEIVAWEALGLAILYVAMKTAQADFCARLLALRLHLSSTPRGWRGWMRLAASQARAQPWALAALCAGAATLVPFPWALAYGQNLSVLGDAPAGRREAAAQTGVAPRQNVVGVLFLLLIFLLVWLNAFAACIFLPQLANRLLGLDNVFSRSGLSFFNPTFLAASLALAWVAFDPLLKAFYTLRIFYGRAVRTGDDLRVDFRLARSAVRWVPCLALLVAGVVRAAPAPAAPPAEAARIDRAIDRALTQPEFAWRLRQAPEESAEASRGPLARFFSAAYTQGKRWFGEMQEFYEKIHRWIFGQDPTPADPSLHHAPSSLVFTYLLPIAAGLGIVGLAFLVGRQMRASRVSVATAAAGAAAAADEPPNLAAEGTDASRLPAAGWLGLARDQARRGEWRLALRAAYLATLAELAAREFIFLARAKTNLDYERELRRRAASRAEVVEGFTRRRAQFEAVWYGSAPADQADVLAWIAEFEEKGAA